MAIQTHDQLVAAHVNPLMWASFTKSALTSVANRWQSMWAAGGTPGAGAAPTSAAIPTKATTGALVNFPTITGGLTAYGDFSAVSDSTAATQVLIFDRLCHMGGLNGTLTTAQTVSTIAPNRGDTTNFSNCVAFFEVYTAIGATIATATISYTNPAGTSGKTAAITLPASAAAGNLFMFPFAAGDQAVKTVENVTLSISTGTAGNFGITVARLVGAINVPVVGAQAPSALSTMGVVPENACLWAVVIPPSTSSGIVQGAIKLIQG